MNARREFACHSKELFALLALFGKKCRFPQSKIETLSTDARIGCSRDASLGASAAGQPRPFLTANLPNVALQLTADEIFISKTAAGHSQKSNIRLA
jgi:hypothetical protein